MVKLKTPDAVLVQEYISGNEKSFEVLLMRHKQKIFNHIFYKIKDREISDDVFQDTFIKVIKSLKSGNYTEQEKFSSWLLCIANNTLMDYFNKSNKVLIIRNTPKYSVMDFVKDANLSAQDIMVNNDIAMDLAMLVEKLPENQKIVIKMRMQEGLTFREIGELTDTSINTVLGNMRYAVNNLKKLIKKHKIDVSDYNIL